MAVNIHVVPTGEGWAVETEGGGQRTMYAKQGEAIRAGWERAKIEKVELMIHGRKGRIGERGLFDRPNKLPPLAQ